MRDIFNKVKLKYENNIMENIIEEDFEEIVFGNVEYNFPVDTFIRLEDNKTISVYKQLMGIDEISIEDNFREQYESSYGDEYDENDYEKKLKDQIEKCSNDFEETIELICKSLNEITGQKPSANWTICDDFEIGYFDIDDKKIAEEYISKIIDKVID